MGCLQFVYTPRPSLYKIFRPQPITFIHQNKTFEGVMDFLFIGAIAAFTIAIWAMVAGCDKLGGQP